MGSKKAGKLAFVSHGKMEEESVSEARDFGLSCNKYKHDGLLRLKFGKGRNDGKQEEERQKEQIM